MTVLSKKLLYIEPIDEERILRNIDSLPTEDDLPYDDGEPMDTGRHRDQMNVLIESLKAYWRDTRPYYVGGDMFLHYDPYNMNKFRGPDFYLVLDVDNKERKSWVVWQEGMRFPDVIIELLSDSTRKIDHVIKKELYEQVFKTKEYYLYDPETQEFLGYTLVAGNYETRLPDCNNKIYSSVTDLCLVIANNWLRWMTKDGMILPTPMELADQALLKLEQEMQNVYQAQLKAEQEKQKADQAQLKAEQEKQKAEQEKQKAKQAQLKAEQEKLRANGMEKNLKQKEKALSQVEQLLEEYRRRFGDLK